MFNKNSWKMMLTFFSTFLLSSFFTDFLVKNEPLKLKTEKETILPEKKTVGMDRKNCFENRYSFEINQIARKRSELEQRRADLHIRLENNKNATTVERNNLYAMIVGLKKQIVEYEKLENRLEQLKKDIEKQYTSPQKSLYQKLLYLQKCYEF